VVLLFLATLLLRTLDSARKVDPGFDTEWTLASYISTSSMGTPIPEREAFFHDLARRFEALAWVQAATVAEQAPLSGHPSQDLRPHGSEETIRVTVARVIPGYFEALSMDVVQGRTFLETDTADAFGVVVVNEALAGRMGGVEDAVGSRLWWPGAEGAEDREFEVVGVVRNARQTNLLATPEPVAYFSLPQHYHRPGNAFLLKVAGNPAAAVQRMEDELRSVDPRIAIVNILPYSRVVDGFLYTQRMNAELFAIIAIIGLVLAAAGVFGVVSLAVARQRKEIGIRLAIGARKGAITKLVMARTGVAVALGLIGGMVVAFLATRLVESLLWGVTPSDPISLVVGLAVLVSSVALALLVPIRRALAVDPVGSLQAD
jgi:predicted permease